MVSSSKTTENAFSFQTGAASSGVASLLAPEVFDLCGGMLKRSYTRLTTRRRGLSWPKLTNEGRRSRHAVWVLYPTSFPNQFIRVTCAIFLGYRMDLQDAVCKDGQAGVELVRGSLAGIYS
jgi:hypothetical protein